MSPRRIVWGRRKVREVVALPGEVVMVKDGRSTRKVAGEEVGSLRIKRKGTQVLNDY
jgi:hypothetical protein